MGVIAEHHCAGGEVRVGFPSLNPAGAKDEIETRVELREDGYAIECL